MNDMILSVRSLPEQLTRRIRGEKVRVHEENGIIMLIPFDDTNEHSRDSIKRLRGMFTDGRISTEKYMAQKQIDKELER